MDNMIYLFAAVVFLAALLASISIWAPRKLWIRGTSVIATAGLIIVSYVGFSDLLSRPKPVHLEWAMRTVTRSACARRFTAGGRGDFRLAANSRCHRAARLQDALEQEFSPAAPRCHGAKPWHPNRRPHALAIQNSGPGKRTETGVLFAAAPFAGGQISRRFRTFDFRGFPLSSLNLASVAAVILLPQQIQFGICVTSDP